MADIRITRGKSLSVVEALSSVGANWLLINCDKDRPYTVDNGCLEDFIQEMIAAGLEVNDS